MIEEFTLSSGKFILISFFLLAVSIVKYKKVNIKHFLLSYLLQTNNFHIITLSIFRIIVFLSLFIISHNNPFDIIWLNSLPTTLFEPLKGSIITNSFNSLALQLIKYIFNIFCIFSIVGFKTPISKIVTVFASFIMFGYCQCFGKVFHMHHLIWFATILCFSRSDSLLSIDNYLDKKSYQHINKNECTFIIRVSTLLMGVIYFFPGFWKFWSCGVSWCLNNNVLLHTIQSLSRKPTFEPIITPEYFAYVNNLGGLYTITFELLFIFLIFNSRFRLLAGFLGLIFHLMTILTMGVSFWYLLICYILFFEFNNSSIPAVLKNKFVFLNHQLNIENNSFSKINWNLQIAGCAIVFMSLFCGVFKLDSWPFTVYPTFDFVQEKIKPTLIFVFYDKDNKIIIHDMSNLINRFNNSRWDLLLKRIYFEKNSSIREDLITSIIFMLKKETSGFNSIKKIVIYKGDLLLIPNYRDTIYNNRSLLYVKTF